MGTLIEFRQRPIQFTYPRVSRKMVTALQHEGAAVRLVGRQGFVLANEYHHAQFSGTRAEMFARQSVARRLDQLYDMAREDGYGVHLFDVFRTQATQLAIFSDIMDRLRGIHPDWDAGQLETETVRYVAHPEKSRYPVLPHNSGGAVDLTLTKDGVPLNMGSGFDDPRLISAATFFEAPYDSTHGMAEDCWVAIRANRRMLFHAMVQLGFTNNQKEWWHYDLGDYLWARTHEIEWNYSSMEREVKALCASQSTHG